MWRKTEKKDGKWDSEGDGEGNGEEKECHVRCKFGKSLFRDEKDYGKEEHYDEVRIVDEL